MSFSKKINELNNVKRNLDKFIGESVLRNKHVLEDNITEDQLFEKGEDGQGNPLGEYADSTKFFKETIAGQLGRSTRSDHITLKDTGEFYKSIEVKLTSKGMEIIADAQKEDTNLLDEFGKAILFVNEENLEAFKRPILLDDVRDNIRAAL